MKQSATRIAVRMLVAVAALGLTSACDDASDPQTDPTTAREGGAERLNIGKADHLSGTCAESCGGQGQGNCWCDDLCAGYGDCCGDFEAVCAESPDASNPECHIGGCSGQVCSDQPGAISTCEFKPEYACYKAEGAACEWQQDSGTCGWTLEGAAAQCLDDLDDSCAPVLCEMLCTDGFATDENGCEICQCNPPAGCGTHDDCAEGEYCQQVWCITTPCPQLCAPVGEVTAPCSQDAMCAEGLSCVDGACAAPKLACDGACGGQSDEGCWCDDACSWYGDCCPGMAESCE